MRDSLPYGSVVTEHFRRPRNYGPLPNATASAEGVNPLCGDFVRVAILVDADGRITDARFSANACAICVAVASLLTERVRGLSCDVVGQLTDDDALAMTGRLGVPPARRRCATLPLETLRRALALVYRAPRTDAVAAVLLAAGSARRFDGSQKLLAHVPAGQKTEPLVRRSASALLDAGLKRVVVVIGRDADRVRECLDGLDVQFAVNDAYASGMSSSLRTGVSEAIRLWPELETLLIALGDQPLAGMGIVESLLSFVTGPDVSKARPIVAPRFGGELGNPVLFARALVPELLEVSGDHGARGVVERDPSRVEYVHFNRATPLDVDTVSDLDALNNAVRRP
ncbi:MAG TPA: NTP transferase domain-containing protein [Gemmatimonadaceae bacterium]|jgi:molybdenum cofactor cytidylyltransferase